MNSRWFPRNTWKARLSPEYRAICYSRHYSPPTSWETWKDWPQLRRFESRQNEVGRRDFSDDSMSMPKATDSGGNRVPATDTACLYLPFYPPRLIHMSYCLTSSSCLQCHPLRSPTCNSFFLYLPRLTVPLVCFSEFTTSSDSVEENTVEDAANTKPQGRDSCYNVISKGKGVQKSH